MSHERWRFRLTGVVQGVGFRPFVYQLARNHSLAGWVRNDSQGVVLEVEGDEPALRIFKSDLVLKSPPLAVIESVAVETIPNQVRFVSLDGPQFDILESNHTMEIATSIPADVATCNDCLVELFDPTNRRFRYPFINCTNCGPRFTIIERLPYDRSSTTMRAFAMCSSCAAEYRDPLSRRFHAQPIACDRCGPKIWWLEGNEHSMDAFGRAGPTKGENAVAACVDCIRKGKIAAVRGIGGFHLACDASNQLAVALLRQRKGRVDKPFAIMVRDLEMAQEVVEGSLFDWQLLQSKERPIVLLRKKADTRLSALLAPGNDFLGVMLAYSPVHHLLLSSYGQPLVMTSGNVSDEPIVNDSIEAKERLKLLVDGFLLHDRPIHAVCDDSVVRSIGHSLLPIRRARGYAPMPIRLLTEGEDVLAVGGEMKATFCFAKGSHAYVSQHIGDMGNVETLESLNRNIHLLETLLQARPTCIACDSHPGYLSAQWARKLATDSGIAIVEIQHHHAHLASLAAEHQLAVEEPIFGFVFDGTGYGTDQTIWGGEALVSQATRLERMSHLQPFLLPGGDAAIRHPYRVALSLLDMAGLPWSTRLPCVQACNVAEQKVLKRQLERRINCVSTTSMGRLFDAVASLIGLRHSVSYEAQAAMELETLAASEINHHVDPCNQSLEVPRSVLDTKMDSFDFPVTYLVTQIVDGMQQGVSMGFLAAQFHLAVVDWMRTVACRIRETRGITRVGLSGGVFQNALLTQLATKALSQERFNVLTHRLVPCNDGGLALGQAWLARLRQRN